MIASIAVVLASSAIFSGQALGYGGGVDCSKCMPVTVTEPSCGTLPRPAYVPCDGDWVCDKTTVKSDCPSSCGLKSNEAWRCVPKSSSSSKVPATTSPATTPCTTTQTKTTTYTSSAVQSSSSNSAKPVTTTTSAPTATTPCTQSTYTSSAVQSSSSNSAKPVTTTTRSLAPTGTPMPTLSSSMRPSSSARPTASPPPDLIYSAATQQSFSLKGFFVLVAAFAFAL